MKRVNTARGPIVDQKALYDALESPAAFSLPAWMSQILNPCRPTARFIELNNLVVCPHIASASWATRARMSLLAAENLIAGLKGERLPNCSQSRGLFCDISRLSSLSPKYQFLLLYSAYVQQKTGTQQSSARFAQRNAVSGRK